MPDIDFNHVAFSYPSHSAYDPPSDRVIIKSDSPDPPSDEARPHVLNGLSFSAEHGELVALVGDNGSGKSTIAKLCGAFLVPSAGSVSMVGIDTRSLDGAGAQELRQVVGMAFQNPDEQFITSTVFDEVAFGPCNMGLPRDEICERVDCALSAVGMLGHLGSNVNKLSGGQRQRIAIADALAMRPEVLILDEPTSMLDAAGRSDVMRAVGSLRDGGMTVLLITHSPEEAKLADRVFAVEDGKCRELDAAELADFELDVDAIAAEVLGEESACAASLGEAACALAAPSGADAPIAPGSIAATAACAPAAPDDASASVAPSGVDAPIIRFEDVSFSYDSSSDAARASGLQLGASPSVISELSLEVHEGEVLALMGPNGSGKSTVLQLMNGLLQPTSGRVLVNGVPVRGRHGANNARSVVGLCFQSPEQSFFSQTVRAEIAFGPESVGLPKDEVDRRSREAALAMALDFDEYAERNPFELSGGERRRLALASVLSMRPKVLALDEPCSGLDRPSREALLKTLLRLKRQGQTVVLVTHDEREAALLADRVIRLDWL